MCSGSVLPVGGGGWHPYFDYAAVIWGHAGKKISELAIGYQGKCITISSNGSDVAVGGADKKIYLYTIENDTLVPGPTKELEAKGALCTMSFSPDGAWLASGVRLRIT